jgi:sulfur carrier protein ThiS
MNVTVKLYATLGQYLPPGAQRNVAQMELPDGITIGELVRELRLPPELTHLVLVNGSYVEPAARAQRVLQPNDELAVFPPIAGG